MKTHNNLIDRIASHENFMLAYQRTCNGKRSSYGYLEFKEYAQANIKALREELLDGSYQIGKYKHFIIYEPKARTISALDFKDRLVQHAVCNVIAPIFDSTLLHNTFACRVNMGTHAGVKYIQSELRKPGATHFLKTDYSKFFPSVDRKVLHVLIRRKVACKKTLAVLSEIIPEDGKGIPIGSLTSQLFANVYGGKIDRFIHHDLGYRRWARYMDDIVILDTDIDRLRSDFYRIQEYSKDKMGMGISKWSCSSVKRGINFLGYRIWDTHKLLRKDSVVRAKRKISKYIRKGETDTLIKFLASWYGHARWADTNNLYTWMERNHDFTCY
jgi:hypothetical protein